MDPETQHNHDENTHRCHTLRTLEIDECTIERYRRVIAKKLLDVATSKKSPPGMLGREAAEACFLVMYAIHYNRAAELMSLAQGLYDELHAKIHDDFSTADEDDEAGGVTIMGGSIDNLPEPVRAIFMRMRRGRSSDTPTKPQDENFDFNKVPDLDQPEKEKPDQAS